MRLTIVNARNVPLCATLKVYKDIDASTTHSSVLREAGLTDAEASGSVVYLIDPPLPFSLPGSPRVDLTAEAKLKLLIHHLKIMSSNNGLDGQVRSTGDEGEVFQSGIQAYLWADHVDLGAWADLIPWENDGINCIVLPPDLKRPILELASTEDSAPKRVDTVQSPLPASVSTETAIEDERTRARVLERAKKLMFALHPDTGLLPTKDGNKYVPYPSLRATISDLGPFIHRAFDGLEHYLYRDRTNLPALISTLKNIFENGQEPLSLIGTRGAGRTHLITTAASLLLGAKIPVVYLAFSTEEPRTSAFRDALLLALSTSPELLAQADTLFDLCCRTADGLQAIVKFCQHLASNRQKLLFILVKPDRLSHDELTTVGQMVLGHALCSVPSSNSQYRTEMEHKAAGGFVKIMYMNGGLSQLEFTEWIQEQQGLHIPPTEMDNINTATGRVPALLATFFRRVEEEGAFKSEQLLLAPHDVSLQLSAHLESVIQNTPQKIDAVLKILYAALHHEVLDEAATLTDQRFIYRDDGRRWNYTSLLDFEAIVRYVLTIEDGIRFFDVEIWVQSIPFLSRNPSMLGYTVEYAVTLELRHGVQVDQKLRIPPLPLHALPPGGQPGTITQDGIYIPLEFNNRYVDCVIVWSKAKDVHVAAVQISTAATSGKHSNSDALFFNEDWKVWKEAVKGPGKTSRFHFIWIIKTACDKKKGTRLARDVYTLAIGDISQKNRKWTAWYNVVLKYLN